jgi:hypothetical protein
VPSSSLASRLRKFQQAHPVRKLDFNETAVRLAASLVRFALSIGRTCQVLIIRYASSPITAR